MTTHPAALSQADAASSLLSLSIAAAGASPIPTPDHPHSAGAAPTYGLLTATLTGPPPLPTVSTSLGSATTATRHRRLASTGKARRRLSDARDAASRPSPALLQSSTAALSLASLTLSSSPPAAGPLTNASTSFVGASNSLNGALPGSLPHVAAQPPSLPLSDGSNFPSSALPKSEDQKASEGASPIAIVHGKHGGRKRGIDHKCESCSKIYRHPSCLIKHRWEHTPHWREASKFVLSKHQQVQLLEAAAILSHLSPSATSLPEDRSLWPSFLSGGSLPRVEPVIGGGHGSPSSYNGNLVSCSVPATSGGVGVDVSNFSRAASSGPRLHDYSIPTSSTGAGGITQLRPGLLGVSTGPGAAASETGETAGAVEGDSSTGSKPVPVPTTNINNGEMDPFAGYLYNHHHHHHHDGAPDSWTSSPPFGSSHTPSSFLSTTGPSSTGVGTGTGGWSLPRSSLRSVSESASSRSRSGSASGSRSDEDDDSVVVDIDIDGVGSAVAAAVATAVVGGGIGVGDAEHSSKYAGRYGRKMVHGGDDEMGVGFSVREEDENEDGVGVGAGDDVNGGIVGAKTAAAKPQETEWDGLEMDMDMD